MSAEFDEAWDLFESDGQTALATSEESVLALEESVDPDEVNRLYRAMHTLKGNARVMGLELMESLAHHAEDLVGLVRDQGHEADDLFFELLLSSLDVLTTMMEQATAARGDVEDERRLPLIERLKAYHQEYAVEQELTASMRALPSQHPGDIFLWSMSPSMAPEGASEAPAGAELPTFPSIHMPAEPMHDPSSEAADPQQDDEFVAIFLELATEQVAELQAAVEALAEDPDATDHLDRARVTIDTLRLAAERMGYGGLEATLQTMEEHRGAGAFDALARELGELRAKLTALEVEGGTPAATGQDPVSLNQAFHAKRLGGHLDALRTAGQGLAEQMDAGRFAGEKIYGAANAAGEALAGVHHGLMHYGLDAAAHAALVLSDFASRIATAEEGLSKAFVQRLEQVVAGLERVVTSTDDMPVTKAVVEGLTTAATGLTDDGASLGADAGRLLAAVPSAMRKYVNGKQLQALQEALEAYRYVYEVRAALGQDEERAAKFFAWMQEHFTTVASAVREVDGEPVSEMLVVSDHGHAELLASLRAWDEAEAVSVDPWTPDAPRLSIVPGISNVPQPIISIVPAPKKEPPMPQLIGVSTSPPPPAPAEAAKPAAAASAEVPAAADGSGKEPKQKKPKPKPKPKQKETGDGLIRLQSSKVDQLMSLAGEINLSVGAVLCHPELEGLDLDGFQTAAHRLEMLIRELQDAAAGLGLTPVLGVFGRMRRLVRDLARQTDKKIELVIEDNETEIDRALVDSIYEPLMHIIRNAADHGLERPEERVAAGKTPQGTIRLVAAQQGGHILIRIEDDGRGLNTERIVARARERGLIEPDEEISEEQAWQLIFAPGFSTAESVSNLSGRGVGMDVVVTTLESLNGRVVVESKEGRGTRVDLLLPLTLAFSEVIVIEVDERLYVVPMSVVSSIFRPEEAQLSDVSADGETVVRLLDELVPVRWLARYFGERADQCSHQVGDRVIVAVQTSRGKVAIPIDRIHGAERVTMKPLPVPMRTIRAAAGCGVLRSGEVAIALDCERLNHERAA